MALSSQRHGTPDLVNLPPELAQQIFGYLNGDNDSLFNIIQVSKACHTDCIGMLWHSSTQKRLGSVTPERRQHYANMIYRWDLDHDPFWDLFDGLDFPLLRELSFSGGCLSDTQLCHCLRVGLHTLRFTRCVLDAAFLETMARSCTRLQRLVISAPDARNITPDQFVTFIQSFPALHRLQLDYIRDNVADKLFDLTFIQSLPALRRLQLSSMKDNIMHKLFRWEASSVAQLEELSWTEDWGSGFDAVLRNRFLQHNTNFRKLHLDQGETLSDDAIIHLASCPSLEVLHIYGWLEEHQLQNRFVDGHSVTHPFPRLKDLWMEGSATPIKALLSSSLRTLVNLNLVLTDNSANVLQAISGLSNLVHLTIIFNCSMKLSRTDLDCISELSMLQTCQIDWMGPSHLGDATNDCPWLTDRYFKGWISKLPLLQDLLLALESATITQASLQSLAECCPSLWKCSLLWEHDINTWELLEAPLFPHLEELHLGKVRDHGWQESQVTLEEDASRDAEVIRSLAPSLTRFKIGLSWFSEYSTPRPHEKALVDAYNAGI